MGYLIGGCINLLAILAAFVLFASLPGVFWGFAIAFLVVVILGIGSGINKNQPTTTTTPASPQNLEDEIRHHEYKNNDPSQGVQHDDNPSVSDDDEDEANR